MRRKSRRGDVTVEASTSATCTAPLRARSAGDARGQDLRKRRAKAPRERIEARARALLRRPPTLLVLSNDGTIRCRAIRSASSNHGDKLFEPRIRILADEQLTGPAATRWRRA
jgi:hypothetical protein